MKWASQQKIRYLKKYTDLLGSDMAVRGFVGADLATVAAVLACSRIF